mgnify:CR=1 FL=1
MSLLTPFLKLFKWDTTNEIDLESEFNIDKSMNENWDKLDTKAQEHENKILDIEDSIEDIQNKDTEQDKLIQKLQSNMINESTEEATSLYVEDASDLPAVLSVKGNHYQEVKNSINELHLIDTPETNLNNGLSYKIEDETIILNGSVESTYALVITTQSNIVDLVKAGEEWTLSAYGENLPELNTFVRITTANNTNALNILLNSETTEGYASISFNENSTTLRIILSANAVYNNSKIKIKLEKGGTKTDYDKYCKMPSIYTPSEVETVKDNIKITQCNKNFFNVPSKNVGGVDLVLQEDGKYKINGTSTINWNFRTGEKTWLKAGDYTMYVEVESGTNNGFFGIRGSNGFKYEVMNSEFNFTEDKEIEPYFTCSGIATFDDVVVKVQLEKSKVKTEWAKHEEKEYNLSVQQEMLDGDYFDLENNKEIHKWGYINTKNVTNLAVSLNTSNKDFRRYSVDLKINNRKSGEYLKMLCTHFKYTDSRWHEYEGICGWESGQTFCIGTFNKELDTAEKMKNYLLNNDVEIYYELAEQEELDLTEEQKEVLQQLNNLDLYKGTNNIYTDQDLALLQLDYTVDTKMYIDNKIANLKEQVNTTNELLSTTGTSAMLLDNLQNDLESEVM